MKASHDFIDCAEYLVELLKINLTAGHGGHSGRYDALREAAFTYAFVLWQMGLSDR